MTLRKIAIDNSVRYFPKTEQTRESELRTLKAGSFLRNQNKNFSQNNKKFNKNVAAKGFPRLTK